MFRNAWCALILTLPAAGQSITSISGVAPYQVLQRNAENVGTLRLEGTAANANNKMVELEVLGTAVRMNARVTRNAWSAVLQGIPTGGPYSLAVKVAGTPMALQVPNILVGDLWVLAGQSNMEGVGNLTDTPLPSPLINSFDQTDEWVVASDPLHRLPDAADKVHWRNKDAQGNPKKLEGEDLRKWVANRKKGAGVGLPFAIEMVRRTNVPIGLIPTAHGGTSMDQWSPSLKDKGGESLYGAMVRRVKAVGGKVKGVLWYQGESDASVKAAPVFETKFKQLIEAVRADFGDPDLPFYYVQIGRHTSLADPKPWNQVQQLQLKMEGEVAKTGMVTCVDCNLDDGIHVGTDDMRLLGARLANLACHDLFPDRAGCGALKRGPRPVSAKANDGVITVEFKEVNGRLSAEGRLNGFSVHDAEGKMVPAIYRQRLSPMQGNAVQLFFGGKLPEGATLHYGAGRDPYVNLRDEAGMGAPAFGPMPITQ